MIYKTLKKVSDVCQLIKNGTFQDGFNGWSSQEISYNIIDGICYCTINEIGNPCIYTFQPTITKYHKYLMSFDIFPNYSNSANTNGFYLKGDIVWYNIIQKQWNKVEKIVTVTWDTVGALVLYVNINPNREIGDIANFKNIQLFDLTEMYGAGNEPTTVEQFRQDFPEEMYDYKPYCFVKSYKTLLKATDNKIITSYKKSLACKTKNLFDINSAEKYSGVVSFQKNGNQIIVSRDTKGFYVSANISLDTSFVGKTITVTSLAKTSGINNTQIRIQWLKDASATGKMILSNKITGNYFQKLTLTGVVPESPAEDYNILGLMFYSNVDASLESGVTYSSTFTDIMIELGDTATEYHPYGYL